ncbi:MAG TPA: SGNH/GDSL hydrolase family protein [Rhodoferax sp.]
MRQFKLMGAALVAALLVAACGGGGGDGNQAPAVKFTSLVSFGDSLSDVGTYDVGVVKQLGGGKWTVNSPTAKNWTELLATQYGLPAPCASETGLPSGSVLYLTTADDIQDHASCLNYAQGSSRVTNAAGPYSEALWQTVYGATLQGAATQNGLTLQVAATVPTIVAAATAAANAKAHQRYMALPIQSQMAKVASYSGSELVTVLAGANDVFMHLNAVSSAAAGGGSAVVAATIAGWTSRSDWSTLQTTLYSGGATAASAAQTAAVQGMATTATELADAIKAQITKGAKHVVVINVPDISITPFGLGAEATTPGTGTLITAMVTTFNSTLATALNGISGVIIVDAFSDSHNQHVNPASYALNNVTTPACDPASAANPLQGSSLTCTAASTLTGVDTSAYLFADTVHPTPYGYKLLAQLVTKSLVIAGWL